MEERYIDEIVIDESVIEDLESRGLSGNAGAQYYLGLEHLRNDRYVVAERWLKLAVMQDHEAAQREYINCYEMELPGFQENVKWRANISSREEASFGAFAVDHSEDFIPYDEYEFSNSQNDDSNNNNDSSDSSDSSEINGLDYFQDSFTQPYASLWNAERNVLQQQRWLGSAPEFQRMLAIDGSEQIEFIRVPSSNIVDSGYDAFGITREKAYRLLTNNIMSVRESILTVMNEALIMDLEKFKDYLVKNRLISIGGALNKAAENFRKRHVNDEAYNKALGKLKSLANNLTIIAAYLRYDILEKQVEGGWTHPVILQAIAKIQGVHLVNWIEEDDLVVPYRSPNEYDFHEIRPFGFSNRIDMLYLPDCSVARLELVENKNTFPESRADNRKWNDESSSVRRSGFFANSKLNFDSSEDESSGDLISMKRNSK